MVKLLWYFLKFSAFISISNGARILAVFPAPFISHQSVFRPLTHELARRGHEVVVITTYPAPKESLPTNLTEIDLHDISFEFRNNFPIKVTGSTNDLYEQVDNLYEMFGKLFEVQINTAEIQNLINDKDQHFDLLLIEAIVRPALVFSHIFKAPVITISSLGSIEIFTDYLGVPHHSILYPTCIYQKLSNLSLREKVNEIYKHYQMERIQQRKEIEEDAMLKRNLGDDVPTLSELKNNVVALMINIHHIWEGNRPVPPNVVYLGGMHLTMNYSEELSTELKSYLDSSEHGVIYVSFGTIVMPSLVENIKIILKAFSKLPYDILLKWDDNYLLGSPSNVKVVKWVPQKKLLHHPNIKLFITQGGVQSTDEAIVAEVPVIGIPILADQWYNAEKYVQFRIGLRIDLEYVTEKKMLEAINTVIDDNSYKQNIIALKTLIYDKPESSLDRAVWWTEYILRNGRSSHLMAPAARMSAWEFYEVDLLLVTALSFTALLFSIVYLGLKLYKSRSKNVKIKFKRN